MATCVLRLGRGPRNVGWSVVLLALGLAACSEKTTDPNSITLAETGGKSNDTPTETTKPVEKPPAAAPDAGASADAGSGASTPSDAVSAGDTPAPADAGAPSDEASTQAAVYAVSTRVNTTDDVSQSFLLTVSAIGEGTTFNLDQAVQLDTDSSTFGSPGQPYVYAASSTEPTITRWELQDDGSLKKGPVLSFASSGASAADSAGLLPFYSKEKAYFIDQFSPNEIEIWNPQSMEIVGSIPLTLDADGALLPQVILGLGKGRLYAVASWQEDFSSDWSRFGDHVHLITIDPETDTIINEVDEPRANSIAWATNASDGSVYFSPSSFYAPIRGILGEPAGISDVSLRIAPGADVFDDGFSADLQAIAGGRPAGDLFLVNDTTAYLRAWHPELVTPIADDKSNWQDVLGEAGFLWWRWQLGSTAADQVADQVPANGTQIFNVDGKTYTPSFSADYSSTVVDELDPSGTIHHGLSGPGQVFGVMRVK